MRHFGLALLLTAGCATAGPAVHYSGEPFDLRQQPGRITGQVCGMDLVLNTQQQDGGVRLNGFIDGRFPVELRAYDDADGRRLQGSLGSSAGNAAVDVTLSPVALSGRVGFRYFDLHATTGDTLAGTMRVAGAIEPADAVIAGRGQLATMSPAAQAALVPTLLQCNVQRVGRWGRSALTVRVGGPSGALPHQSSALYTHD